MRSEADLLSHQQEAIIRIERLLRVRGGALLADEAGTGKSWIAAAVARRWQERGATVSIVVPAPLEAQWRELLGSWGCRARVISHDSVRPADPADLVIVDEAHRFRNPGTRRHARLAIHCSGAAVLLVTATPAVNGPEDVVNLLRLFLEDDALGEIGIASLEEAVEHDAIEELGAACRTVTIRRRARSVALPIPVAVEMTVTFPLPGSWPALAAGIEDLVFPGSQRSVAGALRALLRRRYLSSPAAFLGTIERQLRYLDRLAAAEKTGRILTRDIHRRVLEDVEGEQSMLFPDAFLQPASVKASVTGARESQSLRRLKVLVEKESSDPKLTALRACLDSRTPALVFTESAETARYLWSHLSASHSCGLITAAGARGAEGQSLPLEELFAAFQAGLLELLVTTDLAAEGVDLHAAVSVIHYDVPWTRVRIEQRVARAARIGSRARHVQSIIMAPESGIDDSMGLIASKLRRCARLFSSESPPWRHVATFPVPRLTRTAPQHAIAAALVSASALDVDLATGLSRRYRAGVEVQLRELNQRGRLPVAVLIRALRRTLATQRATRREIPEGDVSTSHAVIEEPALF